MHQFAEVSFEVGGAVLEVDLRRPEDGTTPLVFIPGWACPRSQALPVAAATGRGAAVVDLPGQGGSSFGDTPPGLVGMAAAVVAVVDRIGWDRVVLVGHSMGGAVAVEAARLLGERAERVLGLDSLTYQNLYPRQGEDAVEAYDAQFAADFAGTMDGLVRSLFTPGADPAVVQGVVDEMTAAPAPQARRSLAALLRWDRDEALASTGTRVDLVVAEAFLAAEAVAQLSPRVGITTTDLGGHFFLVEDPAATAALLLEVLGT